MIRTEKGAMIVVLPVEGTITEAEAATDEIRSRLDGAVRIEVQAEALRMIDTAYLQMVLSLKRTADEWGVPFSVSGISDALRAACELYGVKPSALSATGLSADSRPNADHPPTSDGGA